MPKRTPRPRGRPRKKRGRKRKDEEEEEEKHEGRWDEGEHLKFIKGSVVHTIL